MNSTEQLLDRMRHAESAHELWAIETTFDALSQIAEHCKRLSLALCEVAAMDPEYAEPAGIIGRAKHRLAEIERS